MSQTDIEDAEHLGRTRQPPAAALGVSNKDLAPLMARAGGAALRGSTIPILECALLSLADNVLTVEATNMELVIRQTLAVRCDATWKAAVNTELLSGVCRRLGADADLTFEHTERAIVLKSGRTRVSFQTLPIEDFPSFQDHGYSVEFTMPTADLLRLLVRTLPFVSDDASRHYLSGVHLVVQQDTLRAAATNGNQLGVASLALPDGAAAMPEMIVPRQAVGEFVKLLEGGGTAAIACAPTKIKLTVGTTTIITKLVDGSFPEIDRVIPQAPPNVLRVDKKVFIRALDLVTVMAERKGSQFVRLEINSESLTVTANDPTTGDAVEVIAQGDMEYEGSPVAVAFQPKYLSEVAKLCRETVEFRFPNETGGPFRARDPSDDSAVFVAMGARF